MLCNFINENPGFVTTDIIKERDIILKYIQQDIPSQYALKSQSMDYVPLDIIPTNDLSSMSRTRLSHLIYVSNKNRNTKNSSFLLSRDEMFISIDNSVDHRTKLWHGEASVHFNNDKIFISQKDLTPLHLLMFKSCNKEMNSIFASLGISEAVFFEQSLEDAERSFIWPSKNFFNELTRDVDEYEYQPLKLNCFHLQNPFSATVGLASFNRHARVALQIANKSK